MQTIKPRRLQKGDTVGIVSPSSPVPQELRAQFDLGVKTLEEMGLKVKIGKHAFDICEHSAGTIKGRVEDINSLWADPEVRMVLMSIGGNTAIHLLPYLDYEMMSRDPKIFSGISDGTTLLTAISAKTGIVTYHGPDLIFTFGLPMPEVIRENIMKTFFDGNVNALKPNPNWEHCSNKKVVGGGWRTVREGKASGVLVGGHIECLLTTTFAGYGPDFEGKILFLEGTGKIEHVDRALVALKLHGVFDKINGLVIGWFEGNNYDGPMTGQPPKDLFLERLSEYNFPILEISELGHDVDNYVFPIGCMASIDAGERKFEILEPTVI